MDCEQCHDRNARPQATRNSLHTLECLYHLPIIGYSSWLLVACVPTRMLPKSSFIRSHCLGDSSHLKSCSSRDRDSAPIHQTPTALSHQAPDHSGLGRANPLVSLEVCHFPDQTSYVRAVIKSRLIRSGEGVKFSSRRSRSPSLPSICSTLPCPTAWWPRPMLDFLLPLHREKRAQCPVWRHFRLPSLAIPEDFLHQ
jgi:hypothetical protein